VLNTSTLVDAREEVWVLPAMTRYEQPGGGTSTSTERMVYYSPEIKGPRIEEARPEWAIYSELAARVRPERRDAVTFRDAAHIREEIAQAVPYYDGIQHLSKQGDVFQWGGAWLCEGGGCPTEDGRGHLLPIELPELRKPEGSFYASTRRGKQFNSMVYADVDSFNGAGRHDVLMNPNDANRLAIREGDAIVAYNRYGSMHGRCKYASVAEGNIELFWPEGNVLMPKGVYEPLAGIPEYNAAVVVEKAETYHALKDTRYLERRIEQLEMELPG